MAIDDGKHGERGFTLRFLLAGLVVVAVQAALAVQAFPGATRMNRQPGVTLLMYAAYGVLMIAVFATVQIASTVARNRGADGTHGLIASAAILQTPQVLVVITKSSVDLALLVAVWWVCAAMILKRASGLTFVQSLGVSLGILGILSLVATGSGFWDGRLSPR